MKRNIILIFIICFGLLFIVVSSEVEWMQDIKYVDLSKENADVRSKGILKLDIHFGKIPLYFIFNRGQVNKKALFYAKASRYTLWITKQGLVFDSQRPKGEEKQLKRYKFKHTDFDHQPKSYERDVSRLMFLGANKDPEIIPLKKTKLTVNYFKGNDSSKWFCDVPTSEAVLYKNIYKNIDLKVYGIEKQIEYDWIVKPGGDPRDIHFEYKNVKETRIDKPGNLVIKTDFGELIHKKPISYQKIEDKKVEVDSEFKKIDKNIFGFKVGEFEKTYDLIIDPVVLLYSTYLVGSGNHNIGYGITVDNMGNTYVTGWTSSSDFPCLNQYQINQGPGDVFVTKIDTTKSGASSLVYSTYLGGTWNERGYSIAVDNKSNVYLTGYTSSKDFPCLNPYQSYQGSGDVFVTKIDTKMKGTSSLIYSTYLGGNSYEDGNGIAIDDTSNVYVTGYTQSPNFPCRNPYQTAQGGDYYGHDVFITKMDTTKKGAHSLVYSTYLGGGEDDCGRRIAVDSKGIAYVVGYTDSTDFPCLKQQQSYQGGRDVFVTKINTKKKGIESLIYSTYLGGSGGEDGYGIAVDTLGNAFVTGYTSSTDFPCLNPYQTYLGLGDVFVTKIDTTKKGARSLVYSTYLGGRGRDSGRGIAIDSLGNIYVTGYTYSTHFPILNQYQTYQGKEDVFVTKIDPTQNAAFSLIYSTYLGGRNNDWGYDITIDSNGNAYVTGYTNSLDFPILNPYQQTYHGERNWESDVFVTKLSNENAPMDNLSIVSIIQPENGATVKGNVNIEVTAEDDDEVKKVEFFIDYKLVHTDTSAPYSYSWDTLSYCCGGHLIKAKAYDSKNQYASDEVIVYVENIIITLNASRQFEKAWIIKKQYGKIDLMVENLESIKIQKYIIYKKIGMRDYQSIGEINASDYQSGTCGYSDKYLEKDKTYTYRVEVLNPDGIVIAKSKEKTI